MQAKKLALIFYKLFFKAFIFSELSTCINHKHLIMFLILNISDNKILDKLRGGDAKLLYFGYI